MGHACEYDRREVLAISASSRESKVKSQKSRALYIYHPNEKYVRKLQHTVIVKFIMKFLFEGHNKALIGTGAAFLRMKAR